jgi:uncharacterized protein (TIGR00255 family)
MTGYGVSQGEFQHKKITVELRSLNSKFLELAIKLPKIYSERELTIRNDCNKFVERGKVNVNISIEQSNNSEEVKMLNVELFKTYYANLKKLANEVGSPESDVFHETLKIPEVWNSKEENINEDEWKCIYQIFQTALNSFNQFRLEEGNTLSIELKQRIQNIVNAIPEVEKFEVSRVPAIKEKMEILLKDTVGQENIDKNRLEQELIYYIEKFDITEEKTRLTTHCNYFIEVMNEPESSGKKLGFISQEIGREINTLGSKANDASMQKIVVGMKDELEKIKEQLLNIL